MARNGTAQAQRRRAVVTGATAGVGRATARALARSGHDVALLARSAEVLETVRAEVEAAGGRAVAIPLDVADAPAVMAAADQVAAAWGGIDLWVNNAMLTVFGPVERITPEVFRRVTEVTYLGAVHGTLAALRHMRPRDAGTILQVGSALSYRGIPLQAPYCAAKFALRGFTDSLRSELLHEGSGVRLTMVQLPGVNTPQFAWARTVMARRHRPLGTVHQPEAIAQAILRAARDAPRELWVGWPAMQSILGSMVAPGLMDRALARRAWDQQLGRWPLAPGDDGAGNLFVAEEHDHGARGPYGAGARDSVTSIGGTAARLAIGAGAAALFGLGLVLAGSVRPRARYAAAGPAAVRSAAARSSGATGLRRTVAPKPPLPSGSAL